MQLLWLENKITNTLQIFSYVIFLYWKGLKSELSILYDTILINRIHRLNTLTQNWVSIRISFGHWSVWIMVKCHNIWQLHFQYSTTPPDGYRDQIYLLDISFGIWFYQIIKVTDICDYFIVIFLVKFLFSVSIIIR